MIEKDYVLGWLLAAIAADPDLRDSWVFKGGTCLRKCYYETYRFSEDLDFTVLAGRPEAPEDVRVIFDRIGTWLLETSGLEIQIDDTSFRRRKNRRGNPTTEGRIAFRGPRRPPQLPKVKIDLTNDEVIVDQPTVRPVTHPYSDASAAEPTPIVGTVVSYTIVDLLAEKIRALAERCRPRDLYDVVHIYRHPDLLGYSEPVRSALEQKCAHAGIEVPTLESILATPFRAEVEQEWGNMLAHQLPHLPPFEDFWGALENVFGWLHENVPMRALPRIDTATSEELDPTWISPRAMTSWRIAAPLEMIRFAGANRLKVDLDYRAMRGRQGPRIVEPYSLRMTKDRNLLLFVVNDYGVLRGYRVDRIVDARIVDEQFTPRFFVEF
ncbi:MAG: nucleotidyl transferase AbiEii/AbiGii toxin family protein [Actinomycetota bacterium]